MTPRRNVCDAPRSPSIEPHHFQRPATDIGQDAIGGRGCRTARPSADILGLLLSPDRTRIGTSGMRCLQRGHEVGTVARVAHRGGGEDLERVSTHRAGDRVIAMHHGERLGHSVLVQPTGRLQSAAQAQHRLFIEDRHGIAALPFVDHEAH